MLDHMTLTVQDLERSKQFYSQALAPLGSEVLMEFEGTCGIGEPGKPSFWLHKGDSAIPSMHFAFVANERADVDAFYEAALAAGGRDNGSPGIREDYHPNYYAAFVFDPEGHNVEAVCQAAPGARRRRAASRPAKRTASKAASKKSRGASGRGSTRSARKPSRRTRKASRGR